MFVYFPESWILWVLKTYLEVGFLLSLCSVVLWKLASCAERNHWRSESVLQYGYLLLCLSLLLPVALSILPREAFPRPAIQVYSEPSGEGSAATASEARAEYRSESSFLGIPRVTLQYRGLEGIALGLVLFFILLNGYLVRQWWSTWSMVRKLPVWRQVGNVTLCVTSAPGCAFATYLWLRAYIVVPTGILSEPLALAMTIRHEGNHLRNRDPAFLYLLLFARVFYFWNPLVRLLQQQIELLQEFACDEYVVGHPRYQPHAYGRCLFQAAESASHSHALRVGTTSMARERVGLTLKRRIVMILSNSRKYRRVPALLLAMLTFTIFASAVLAASAVGRKQISLSEAQSYAKVASEKSGLPIEVNDLVLKHLNRFIGTAEGRKRTVDAFARLPQYESMILEIFSKHQIPPELVAIALFESGLRNDLISTMQARGIWQFIPATARRYHLTVSESVDERLDPTKETRAAAEYLRDLHKIFGDWRLAIKAYNEGENKVAKLMEKHGTRDPWKLERAESAESYLSGAMAKMVLYHNRHLFQ
jgi:membrane-bound lytic murein transglycosylase D